MMNHKISIIIPTYNKSNLLKRAIQSAVNQTFENTEIIVVDDGSTDDTKEVVYSFLKEYPHIKYLHQVHSGCPAVSTNTGIGQSSGDFIAILEHDDEWLPQKLEKQIKIFQKDNNVGLVSCDALRIHERQEIYVKAPRHFDGIRDELLKVNVVCSASSTLIPKKVFDDVGLFDEKLNHAQDWEMWIRIASKGYLFKFITDPLFKYYIHGNNFYLTSSVKEKEDDLMYIFNKYKEYYERDHKLYSDKLRYDGTRYVLMDKMKEGRNKFITSIKKNPFNLLSYVYLCISFLGSNVYRKLTEMKSKI